MRPRMIVNGWRVAVFAVAILIVLSYITKFFSRYVQDVLALNPSTDVVLDTIILALVVFPFIVLSATAVANYVNEANNKFAMLVRQNITGIYILQDGKFQYVNPMLAQMTGYSKQDLTNGSVGLKDLLDPPSLSKVNSAASKKLSGEVVDQHYEVKSVTKSGETKWLEVYSVLGTYRRRPAIIGTVVDRTEQKRMQMELAQQEQQYRALFEHNPNAVYTLDKKGCFTRVNPVGPDIVGYSIDELIGTNFSRLIASQDLPKTLTAFQRALSGHSQRLELQVIHKLGTHKTLEVIMVPIVVDGQIEGVHGIAKDVTAEKKSEALLVGQTQVLERIAKSEDLPSVFTDVIHMAEVQFEKSVAFIYELDKTANRLVLVAGPHVPDGFNETFGVVELGHPCGACSTAALTKKCTFVTDLTAEPWSENVRNAARSLHFKSVWTIPFMNANDDVLGTFAVAFSTEQKPTQKDMDVIKTMSYLVGLAMERKQSEEHVEHLAYYDPLTDLPNRRLFFERLSDAMEEAKQNETRFAVMYVDVDRFKQVNDLLGHASGDKLLRDVAQRLKNSIRETDTVARMSGDEFTIVLTPVTSVEDVREVARTIVDNFNKPFILGTNEFSITTSIGFSLYPDDADDPQTLLRNADVAMYSAKALGKNTFEMYSSAMNANTRDSLVLQSSMSRALENREFVLYYQPRVNLQTGRIVSAEALIRWNHPVRGMIPPNDFIGLAEESGFIVKLGKWVIEEACRQNKVWQDAGYTPIRVAVNVSAQQFFRNHIVRTIADALKTSGLDAEYLEIEITEGTLIKHESTILRILESLHTMGVHISIDDFGTGYSSLNYLKQFKVDTLKIDRSFVSGVPHQPDDTVIAESIIALAHALRLNVIAEGVETEEQRQFLSAKQCDEVQGYLTGRPVSPEEFEVFLS